MMPARSKLIVQLKSLRAHPRHALDDESYAEFLMLTPRERGEWLVRNILGLEDISVHQDDKFGDIKRRIADTRDRLDTLGVTVADLSNAVRQVERRLRDLERDK